MARYIFCILLGVFLMLGINSVLNKDAQEFRIKTGTATSIQHYIGPDQCDFEAIQPSEKGDQAVNNQGYSCKANCGIPGTLISSRTIHPSKILRFNPTTLAILALSSLNSQLPEKTWTNPSFDTNLTKFSYRYYIYTLGRILI